MNALDDPTAALVRVAAALPEAAHEPLVARFREAREVGVAAEWLDELVLSAVLFVGFPRALVAAGALRTVVPEAGAALDGADYDHWPEWRRRGEAACRVVYGRNYDALRANVRRLHPALDAWVVLDGYGRTLSRPGLDLKRREFCAIAMLVPQQVPRQLHSHLRGALNAGATVEEVECALTVSTRGSELPAPRAEAAWTLWREVLAAAD